MLPTAMCNGCPVNSTSAQPTMCFGQFSLNFPNSVAGSCFFSFSTPGFGVGVGVGCWAQRLIESTMNARMNRRTAFSLPAGRTLLCGFLCFLTRLPNGFLGCSFFLGRLLCFGFLSPLLAMRVQPPPNCLYPPGAVPLRVQRVDVD